MCASCTRSTRVDDTCRTENRWVQLRRGVLLAAAPTLGAALVATMLWHSEIPVPAVAESVASVVAAVNMNTAP